MLESGDFDVLLTTNTGSTVDRGGTDVITANELKTTDSDTAPAQLIYTVETAPANGSLRLNGNPTPSFSQADIDAGVVTYVHNGSAANSDSFVFRVSDGTTTLAGNTFRITVNGASGTPSVTTNTGSTVPRGGTDIISPSELNTSDSNTPPQQLVYTVTTQPANGTVRLNGVPVNNFTQADINASLVSYVHNNSQTTSDNFVFSVTDGATTLVGNTFSITVTAATGVPAVTTNTGSTVARGGTDPISSSELRTTDSNTSDDQLTYTVTSAPANGTLRLNGVTTNTFTQANINTGAVTYVHNNSQTGSDSFGFSVSDGSNIVSGNTFVITITGVAGTPAVTTNTGSSVIRGSTDTISSSELTTTDSNTLPEQLTYTVTTAPTNGTLRLSGAPASTFTQADINANRVTYQHSGTQTSSDSFVFRVSDGTSTVSGVTFSITVTNPPGTPAIVTNTGSTAPRGGTDTISSSELNTTDSNTAADQLVYTMTTAPANGSVRINGLPVTSFTQADINAGRVKYVHNGTQTNSDSFVFRVTDGTTTLSGNTFAITVTGVAGAPATTTNTGSTVTRGGTDVIAASELTTSDTDSGADQLIYIVTTSPASGSLRRDGTQTNSFTQADINAGKVTYVHNGTATSTDHFVFSVTDGITTLTGNFFAFTIASISGLSVVDGKLTMEGSSDDDTVTITGVGVGTGVFQVTAQRGTQPALTQTVSGVSNIVVNLHGGNDRLTMNNALINGEIDIQMEAGDDTVILGNQSPVSTGRELRVDLGAGNDNLDAKRLFIATNQIINGGDGNDSLIFDGFLSPQFTLGTSARGNVSWSGGAGHDFVHVIYGFIIGSWTIDLGEGSDMLDVFGSAVSGNVQAFGRAGSDSLRIDTNFFDAALLIDGNGDGDFIFLANGLGTEVATIEGGDGADLITVQNQTAGVLQVNTGAGNDAVEVRSSAFDRFFAQLGDDNDTLTVRGNLSRFETVLDGGNGAFDRFLDLGNSFFGAFVKNGFEL